MRYEKELNELFRKSNPFQDALRRIDDLVGWKRPELRWRYETPAIRLEAELHRLAGMPRTGFEQFLEEDRRRKEMLGGLAGSTLQGIMSAVSRTAQEEARLNALLRPLSDTTAKLLKMSLEPVGGISGETLSRLGVNAFWEDMQRQLADKAAPWLSMNQMASAHLVEIAQLSAASQFQAGQIDWLHLGEKTGLHPALRETLEQRVTSLAGAHLGFYDSLVADPSRLMAWPPLVTEAPARELMYSISSIGAIWASEEEEEAAVEEEISLPLAPGTIENLLAAVGPELIVMLSGAREIITSENPERQRYLCTSLRELLTQVLHRAAPDEQIGQWTSAPADFHQGRPTRRTRLRYIARSVAHGPFEEFLNQDVKTMLALLEVLNGGTHGPAANLTECQMQVLLIRAEQVIETLLLLNDIS